MPLSRECCCNSKIVSKAEDSSVEKILLSPHREVMAYGEFSGDCVGKGWPLIELFPVRVLIMPVS